MPTTIAIAAGVTATQHTVGAPGQGSLGQGLLGMWDMGRTNLLKWSEDFSNAYWGKTGVSVSSGFSDPFGGAQSQKLTELVGLTFHGVNESPSVAGSYTFSVYLKAAERNIVALANANDGAGARFDLSGGTIINDGGGTAGIAAAGNGWYRCSWSKSNFVSFAQGIYLQTSSAGGAVVQQYTGDGVSGIYVFGAQLELGPAATTYQKTTDSQLIPNQAPGQSALTLQVGSTTGVDTNDPQPYLEDSGRRNLLLNTEAFDAASWISGLGSITATNVADPSGGTTADVWTATAGGSSLSQHANSSSVAPGDLLTGSVWLRCTVGATLTLRLKRGDGTTYEEGALAVTPTAAWTRYALTKTFTIAHSVIDFALEGSSVGLAIEIYGAQLERGPVATAYQPVGASYANKTAVTGFTTDDYILSPTIPQLSMSGDWTIYVCAKFDGTAGSVAGMSDPTIGVQSAWFQMVSAGNVYGRSQNVGTVNNTPTLAVPQTSYVAMALSSQSGTLRLKRLDNGITVTAANANPTGIPRFGMGAVVNSSPSIIADSLKLALPVLLYSRATTAAEDSRILRWYKDKAGQIGLPIL